MHYSGPGRTAFRMYSQDTSGTFRVSVAHGNPEHGEYALFHEQIYLGNCTPGFVSQVRFLSRASRWLRQHVRDYDIFHGLSGYMVTLWPALVAHRLGLPAVVKLIAWQADMAEKQAWKTWLGVYRRRRRQLSQLDGVIAITPAIVDELLGYGVPDHKIARIPNGVDVKLYQPLRDTSQRTAQRLELGWKDIPTLLFAGGINERKRPHLLIDAISHLRQKKLDVQLILAGPIDDVAYADQMRKRAREAGVETLVHWQGVVRSMVPLYQASDVFCLPSRLEGMPNAVLEAMATGVPCLVTPISGSRDLIAHQQQGLHIQPDSEDIANAIQQLLSHPSEAAAYAAAARAKVEAEYDVRRVLGAHERLFRNVIAGRDPADASLLSR